MEYQYDKKDRLEYVYNESSLVAHYTYDENGNRSTLEYGNGVLTRYKYNLSNNLKELTNKIGETVISQYSYTHYLDGNQASKFDGVDEYNYTYDALGRITEVVKNDETINTYIYDDYNNRESMTTLEGATQYVYDKENRLIEEINTIGDTQNITRYNYDNNGNQIYKSTETLEPQTEGIESLGSYIREVESEIPVDVTINKYNELNQLVETISNNNTAKYAYNYNGLRISKSVNGATTEYIWDGNNIVLELDNNGNITVEYIRGINLISRESTNENPEYYLYNGHGDVVQLTDINGVKLKEYDYDIFGNEINQDPNDTNSFRYSGEYYDKETGTYYLRARYYDPSIGRFIMEDSYRGKHQDPMSLNLYTYCGNNPIRYIDPSGHDNDDLEKGYGKEFEIEYPRSIDASKDLLEELSTWFNKKDSGVLLVYGEAQVTCALHLVDKDGYAIDRNGNIVYFHGNDIAATLNINASITKKIVYYPNYEESKEILGNTAYAELSGGTPIVGLGVGATNYDISKEKYFIIYGGISRYEIKGIKASAFPVDITPTGVSFIREIIPLSKEEKERALERINGMNLGSL